MKDLAPKTARGYKAQLKSALDWLYDNHYSTFPETSFFLPFTVKTEAA